MILGGALNLKGMTSKEASDAVSSKIQRDKLEASANVQGFGTPYEDKGEMYRDVKRGGSVVGRQSLGKKSSKQGRWFQSPDGSDIKWVTTDSAPPSGYGAVADPGVAAMRDLTMQGKEVQTAEKFAKYQSWIDTAIESGDDMESLKPYIDMVNQYDKNWQYVPEVSEPTMIGNREIPWTGGKTTWKKVPKTPNAVFNNSTQQQAFPGAPSVGTVSDGYRYKGGDPNNQTSWETI